MTYSDIARWSGLATMLSGALLIVKGVGIIMSDADPSLVHPATLLLALVQGIGFVISDG